MLNNRTARLAALAAGVIALSGQSAFALPRFDGWNTPANVESLPRSSPNINTPAVDGCVSLSPDGLTLAFTSNRTTDFNIYVATRPNTAMGFGNPVPLPAPINSIYDDACPTLAQGNRLYFSSNRVNADYDIYVTQRTGQGWTPPVRLGPNVNTTGRVDESAALYVVGGHQILLFSSRNPDGTDGKIFQSVDGGPKALVAGGPNTAGSNNRPSITHDGKTIFFDSDRPGTLGGPDLYYATRPTPLGSFGPAVHLESLSSPVFDARPFISWEGNMLTFSSARAGSESPAPDIWFATR